MSKTVNANDVLKAYFPEPGDNSPRALAIIEQRKTIQSIARRYNILAMHVLRGLGHPAGVPHDDNCGRPCRFDPLGHDCCEVCNDAETVLERTTNERDG